MKKAKLLPSVLMAVLCVAILVIGIYSVTPSSQNIVGTVKITAANANVRITAYLDDGDGTKANDVQASSVYVSRTPTQMTLYSEVLNFDCSKYVDLADVPDKALYFKVENLSNYALGTYFLQGTVGSNGTEESNIAESKSFNGTMGTETISNLITATFTPYTKVPVGGEAYMYSTLKINQMPTQVSSVTIDMNLNVEPFNEDLVPKNLISVANASNLNVTIDCSVENASTTPTATITKSGKWQAGALAFAEDEDDYLWNGELRLKTIKMKMLVTNYDSKPVSVTITEGSSNTEQTEVKVSVLGNSYIAPNSTEEISVQFAAIYEGYLGVPPEIAPYNYTVNIKGTQEVTTDDILALIDYDETGIANGTLHFFIPFGDNPYVEGEHLRWFIWAKDFEGYPTTLEDGVDYDGRTFLGGGTYYFISEYILDVSKEEYQCDLAFSNEYYYSDGINFEGNNVSDYAGSNLRNYLNGLTVRSSIYDDTDVKIPAGAYCNFYDEFNLTDYAIFSKISALDLENLYTTGAYNGVNDLPSAYAGQTDKFWALSLNDWGVLTNSGNDYQNAVAYMLSGGTSNDASYWWLRSPNGGNLEYCVDLEGFYGEFDLFYDYLAGVRPAFQLQI